MNIHFVFNKINVPSNLYIHTIREYKGKVVIVGCVLPKRKRYQLSFVEESGKVQMINGKHMYICDEYTE